MHVNQWVQSNRWLRTVLHHLFQKVFVTYACRIRFLEFLAKSLGNEVVIDAISEKFLTKLLECSFDQ